MIALKAYVSALEYMTYTMGATVTGYRVENYPKLDNDDRYIEINILTSEIVEKIADDWWMVKKHPSADRERNDRDEPPEPTRFN